MCFKEWCSSSPTSYSHYLLLCLHQRECCLHRRPLKKLSWFYFLHWSFCLCSFNSGPVTPTVIRPTQTHHQRCQSLHLLFIVHFTVCAHHPASSGGLPTWVCRQSLSLVCICGELSGICHTSLCVWVHRTQLCRTKHDLLTTACCATEGEQQSPIQLPQSCQEELVFLFSPFPWGFVVEVRTALGKPDRHVYFSFMAASLIKGTKQYTVCFLLLSPPRRQRKGDTNEVRKRKCYMKMPEAAHRFVNLSLFKGNAYTWLVFCQWGYSWNLHFEANWSLFHRSELSDLRLSLEVRDTRAMHAGSHTGCDVCSEKSNCRTGRNVQTCQLLIPFLRPLNP